MQVRLEAHLGLSVYHYRRPDPKYIKTSFFGTSGEMDVAVTAKADPVCSLLPSLPSFARFTHH